MKVRMRTRRYRRSEDIPRCDSVRGAGGDSVGGIGTKIYEWMVLKNTFMMTFSVAEQNVSYIFVWCLCGCVRLCSGSPLNTSLYQNFVLK